MDQEEEKVTLLMYSGFIDKSEFRDKVFNGSKYFYQRTIIALSQADSEFKEKYKYYHLKNNLPKHLVISILEHIDLGFNFKRG